MFMFAEFDVRWFPDQICGLLNAEKRLCCCSVVHAYLEIFFFFSRSCLSMFFIKRIEKSFTSGIGSGEVKPILNQSSKHDYTVNTSRPVGTPGTTKADSSCLNPARDQAVISSNTRSIASSTVWTQRLKVLSFLSFQMIQHTKMTRESKPLLPALGICFRASVHHEGKLNVSVLGVTRSHPILRKILNQISLEKGQVVRM